MKKLSLPYYKEYKKYTFRIIMKSNIALEKRNDVSLGSYLCLVARTKTFKTKVTFKNSTRTIIKFKDSTNR